MATYTQVEGKRPYGVAMGLAWCWAPRIKDSIPDRPDYLPPPVWSRLEGEHWPTPEAALAAADAAYERAVAEGNMGPIEGVG